MSLINGDGQEEYGWIDGCGKFLKVPVMGHYDYVATVFRQEDDPMIAALRQGWVQVRAVGRELSIFLFVTTPVSRAALSHYVHDTRRDREIDRLVINNAVFSSLGQAARYLSGLPTLEQMEPAWGRAAMLQAAE